jgi:hypothetical protein
MTEYASSPALRPRARRRAGNEPKRKRSPATVAAKAYEPTPSESKALEEYRVKARANPFAPRVKIERTKDGAPRLTLDHPDMATSFALLENATGIHDIEVLLVLLDQLGNAASTGKEISELKLNAMLSTVKSIQPRDQLEAMLAAQMAATHNAVMTFARRLNHVDNIPQQDSAERAFNKLCRTFAAQLEALKRYRSAGEQTVRVEHVTVNEGGQAIVGNVTARGRPSPQKPEATP